MTSPTSVQIDNVHFRYPGDDAAVLDGLSLRVEAGERVAVLGPNGSGKTTLALHLNGLLELQTGRIAIGDLEMAPKNLAEIRRRVGMVFQDPDDQLFMSTVREDVAFGPANLDIPPDRIDAIVTDALEAVGAADLAERSPHLLSGGEKRRVALATVLAMSPRLLVLDEPTMGIDPVGRREFAELLVGLPPTQLLVTHDLPFALASCPRSVIIDRGVVAVDLPTADLLDEPELLAEHQLELPRGWSPPPR